MKARLNNAPGVVRTNIKPQVDKYTFPDGHEIFPLAEDRLVILGFPTGHPSFVMSNSFSNQTLAQIDLWRHKPKTATRWASTRCRSTWTRKWRV